MCGWRCDSNSRISSTFIKLLAFQAEIIKGKLFLAVCAQIQHATFLNKLRLEY